MTQKIIITDKSRVLIHFFINNRVILYKDVSFYTILKLKKSFSFTRLHKINTFVQNSVRKIIIVETF